MAQVQFKATGITDSNKDAIQDAGMALDGVSWVNVNPTNIVITYTEGTNLEAVQEAIKAVDSSISFD